jgi:hypothetical protein
LEAPEYGRRASGVGLGCNNNDRNTCQAIAAANGLTSFATMEANCSILVRDAEKGIIQ